jgi:hypothetical protein
MTPPRGSLLFRLRWNRHELVYLIQELRNLETALDQTGDTPERDTVRHALRLASRTLFLVDHPGEQ